MPGSFAFKSASRGRAAARRRARAAEEVALAEAGLELAQRGELLGGLDALGDDLELERAREVDDHADEASSRGGPLVRPSMNGLAIFSVSSGSECR